MAINLALQLYSLRDYKKGNVPALLSDVKNAGYDGVEFAGFYGMDAKPLRSLLDSLGLKSEGSHTGYDLVKDHLDEVIEYNLAIGTKYIIIPGAKLDNRDDYLSLAELCVKSSEKINKAGMKLLYHNHNHEFQTTIDGMPGLEFLRENTPSEALGFQIDVFWAFHAGYDPVETMNRFGSRCVTVHLKDMNNQNEKKMTEVGTGIVDIGGVIKKGKEMSFEWFTVEQDDIYIDPLKSITTSAANVRKIEAK